MKTFCLDSSLNYVSAGDQLLCSASPSSSGVAQAIAEANAAAEASAAAANTSALVVATFAATNPSPSMVAMAAATTTAANAAKAAAGAVAAADAQVKAAEASGALAHHVTFTQVYVNGNSPKDAGNMATVMAYVLQVMCVEATGSGGVKLLLGGATDVTKGLRIDKECDEIQAGIDKSVGKLMTQQHSPTFAVSLKRALAWTNPLAIKSFPTGISIEKLSSELANPPIILHIMCHMSEKGLFLVDTEVIMICFAVHLRIAEEPP